MSRAVNHEPIAVIGMAGRFPGAQDVDALWANLRAGRESITRIPREELLRWGVAAEVVDDPAFVPAKGVLAQSDCFDAALFGVGAREAEMMDPQQRVFLECVWEALEAAGCDPMRYRGSIGLWAGCGTTDYGHRHVWRNKALRQSVGSFPITIANDKDFLATRVAYKLNLRGPAITVQTACSTSLVAIGMACRSLDAGECDIALAGGSSVTLPEDAGYIFKPGMILSPDGRCRAFDASAHGTVPSDAVAAVVLKPLANALRDGDRVLAVVRGFGLNNDGSSKAGFVAPSPAGQADAIRRALEDAGVPPESVTYIETHGTGTELGDPIEIEALTAAYGQGGSTTKTGWCAIGSIKTNIGHTNAAAGVTGFIKAVECLTHRELPPSLHFESPNPRIDFASSPFTVNTALRSWDNASPRRAGVSSFGVGGTNAHVILEEAPSVPSSTPSKGPQLLPVSAASEDALAAASSRLAKRLDRHPAWNLADVAATLQTGRRELAWRRFVIADSVPDAARRLSNPDPAAFSKAVNTGSPAGVAFLFPGQGSQHPGMALGLRDSEPVFRREFDDCCRIAKECAGIDILAAISDANDDRLREVAQPALFAVEYALARLLGHWGIRPAAMVGHSLGEYAAATIAGVFELDAAVRLVCERNRLVLTTAPGAMLALPLPEEEAAALTGPGVSLAVVNGEALCVLSGDIASIDQLEARLARNGRAGRRLRVARGMHSELMDPILPALKDAVVVARPKAPAIPFLSTLTGRWIDADEAQDPEYWASHLRNAVRFDRASRELFRHSDWTLLEVGPGEVLSSLVRRNPQRNAAQAVMVTLGAASSECDDRTRLLGAAGGLWTRGYAVNWDALHEGQRRQRVALPSYPFERQRYWIAAPRDNDAETTLDEAAPVAPEPASKADITDWFYTQEWLKLPPTAPLSDSELADRTWLLFDDGRELASGVARRLHEARVVIVQAGDRFERRGPFHFTVDPWDQESYRLLAVALEESNLLPDTVVHLWTAGPVEAENEGAQSRLAALDQAETDGFYSLIHLAQAFGALARPLEALLAVVTRGVFGAGGSGVPAPERALSLGPVKVIPAEYPSVRCLLIDAGEDGTPDALLRETLRPSEEPHRLAALRGDVAWEPSLKQSGISPPLPSDAGIPQLRQNGVYLITGGLGGIGLTLADWLAREYQARLVLLSRSAPNAEATARIRVMEESGAEVLVQAADVSSADEVEAAVQIALRRLGCIHGVIHSAGIAGGGVIQRKTRLDASRVIDPKVRGALNLEAALAGVPLDFFVTCSSLTAAIGGFGQVDYCAANCFLDAHAISRRPGSNTLYQAIAWDGWQEVGMAARMAAPPEGLLGARRDLPGGGVEFAILLDPARHWVIGDHRVAGRHTLVGTCYLELARQASAAVLGTQMVSIADAVFPEALVVDPGEVARLTLRLTPEDGEWRVELRSDHQTHLLCRVARLAGDAPPPEPVAEWLLRCPRKFPVDRLFALREGAVELGSRWRCLEAIHHGENEAVALVEAPAEAAAELATLALHPALLDMATGFYVSEAEHGHLPFAYGRVDVFRPLPPRFYSRVRVLSDPESTLRRMDVTLADEHGSILVAVRDYCLKAQQLVAAGGAH